MQSLLGQEEVAAVRQAVRAGQRLDGRGLLDCPPIEIDTGIIEQAAGSSMVRMGGAEVLVGVKAEVGKPLEHHPDEGVALIGVQIAAGAMPSLEPRRLDDEGAVLAGQLDRLLLARGLDRPAIDLQRLCIIRGEACWLLHVDCVVLAAGGSVLMALCAGVHKALQDARIPRVSVDTGIEDASMEDIEVDVDHVAGDAVDASHLPVILSACQIGDRVLLASTAEEQEAAQSIVHVSVAADGRICGMLKAGRHMLDLSVLQQLLTTAQRAGRELYAAMQQPLDEEED